MNSENSKTSDLYWLVLNLIDKMSLWKGDECVPLLGLSIYYTWKNIRKLYRNNEFKISHGMKNLNYQMDLILYQIFRTISNTSPKIVKQLLINALTGIEGKVPGVNGVVTTATLNTKSHIDWKQNVWLLLNLSSNNL